MGDADFTGLGWSLDETSFRRSSGDAELCGFYDPYFEKMTHCPGITGWPGLISRIGSHPYLYIGLKSVGHTLRAGPSSLLGVLHTV